MSAYSDLNVAFGTPGASAIVQGDQCIKMAVQIFVTSMVGARSRTFNPTWGCDLPKILQEPFGDVTANAIRATLVAALGRYEPRIEIMAPLTRVSPRPEIQAYEVLLVYRHRGVGHARSYSFVIDTQLEQS